jgi:RNA polymerase subunit RPABC4/transcription elongation factor Spt4
MEQIPGFDIDIRILSREEKTRDITLERFNEFHYLVGEDFCDTCGHTVNGQIFAGYIMGIHPEWSSEILKKCNTKHGPEPLSMMYVYIDMLDIDDEEKKCDVFYTDFSNFINLTSYLKERINMILIRVEEEYSD